MRRCVLFAGLLVLGCAPATAQEWPPFPKCPPTVSTPWSMAESPTRALIVRHWFDALHAKIPAAALPARLLALDANEPVTACRVASLGAATVGLGFNSDTAIVIISAGGIDEVVRIDSSVVEVYLPPNRMNDVTAETRPSDMGPNWPVIFIGKTPPTDLIAIEVALANVFEVGKELIAFSADMPDQPGIDRRERLVIGDACGRVGHSVQMQGGVIRIVGASGEVPTCARGKLRALLAKTPRYTVRGDTVTLTVGRTQLVLRRTAGPSIGNARIVRYAIGDVVNTVAADAKFGAGGLQSLNVYDGCNSIGTHIAFGTKRFVIDPSQQTTLRACTNAVPTAAVPLLSNPSGSGTWTLSSKTLTLTFNDGAQAVFAR
jgi:hypothetical protein